MFQILRRTGPIFEKKIIIGEFSYDSKSNAKCNKRTWPNKLVQVRKMYKKNKRTLEYSNVPNKRGVRITV